jgi:hypothetical protein
MEIELYSDDERRRVRLDADVTSSADGLVIVDGEGREHHFGCGAWDPQGRFRYVATYADEGREPPYSHDEVIEALERGWRVADTPRFGPRLSPLVRVALEGLAQRASKHKGFIGAPERTLAIRYLRALLNEAGQAFDPEEVEVWAATHGWAAKGAKDLGKLAEGVLEGRQFRDWDRRAIGENPEQERQMVEYWRAKLEERDGQESDASA